MLQVCAVAIVASFGKDNVCLFTYCCFPASKEVEVRLMVRQALWCAVIFECTASCELTGKG